MQGLLEILSGWMHSGVHPEPLTWSRLTCHHRHPLESSALHILDQRACLRDSSWSDSEQCRLTCIRPRRPIRPAWRESILLVGYSKSATSLPPPDALYLRSWFDSRPMLLKSFLTPVLFQRPPSVSSGDPSNPHGPLRTNVHDPTCGIG
jgi:hypothetical protein